jgi:type I restriction enzyme S subunit
MTQAIRASGQPDLGLQSIRLLGLPLAPPEEQSEIIRRVDEMFAFAGRLEARVATARKRVEALTQSILAKAFRGELVPTEAELAEAEGREYETASMLLERVKANVNGAAPSKSPRATKRRA